MPKSTLLLLLFALLAPTLAKPHSNIGPKGEWVSNGRWQLKVHSVDLADSRSEFLSLPWTKAIVSAKGKAYTNQVERLVFSKKGRLLLLDVSLKNSVQGSQKIGYDTPPWFVRCTDGQEVRNTGSISNGARSFVAGALPKFGPVAPGQVVRGKMAFALPADAEPKLLFFKASQSIEKYVGKSESLVSRLGAKSSSTAKALEPNRPKAAWQRNTRWSMRLIDSRVVTTAQSYGALPWGERLKGTQRSKHFSYVERNVFNKGGQVLLLGLEVKNASDSKRDIGYEIPFWQVHGAGGKILKLQGVYQQQIPWALVGGMPKRAKLNAKAQTRGTLGFFLPKGFQPVKLDFQIPKSLEKHYGASGSLSFKL